jgi:hypothetical protein
MHASKFALPLLGNFVLALGAASFAPAGTTPRSVRAVRVVTPPLIDGNLNDSVWMSAIPATDFTQRDPDEGKPASERTEIRVLFDHEALYFGCMFYDSNPAGIVARMMRRDDEGESDWGSIRMDTFHDLRNAYEFSFNPAGVKVDILQFDDGDREDESWDAVWDLETKITDSGWVAEVRVPFSMLHYSSSASDTDEEEWGINFIRTISRRNETARWAFTPKKEGGFISRFGHLTGLVDLPSPRRIELRPFVLGRQQWDPASYYGPASSTFFAGGGLDLKMGIGNNFMLDATINPDFGQVEADPAVLNLSTVETFYPEKRPFFIEGTQIFQFNTFGGGSGMFYSRRIGRALSADEVDVPEEGQLVELPQTTTILAAAKLSGKFSSGTSIGVLEAFTQEERAIVEDAHGIRGEQVLEPRAHFNVVRIRQDVLDGSYLGGIFTTVAQDTRLPAFTGAADWYLRFDDAAYRCSGFLAGSHTSTFDGDRISGTAGKAEVARIGAEHWLWSLEFDYTSPRYNINDVGYFRRPNDYGGMATVTYKEDVPAPIVRNYNVSLTAHERSNFDGANLNHDVQMEGSIQFANYWTADLSSEFGFGEYDDRETRGNGLYAKPHTGGVAASVETDGRQPVSLQLNQHFIWDQKGKSGVGTDVGFEIRPTSWMEWEVEMAYSRIRSEEAWVQNLETSTGLSSIFGDRTTDELDMTVRGSVTFTRDLTFQMYSQVFVAKGRHESFRKLVGASDFVPIEYSGNPDFNSHSFHLNMVLRWEYLPGSTLYLVWSQERGGGNQEFYRSFADDMRDAFGQAPANVLLLKLTYWWSV